ncbi:MAG: sensor histidine kinase [Flavobacteriaceae bacterium]|nr:sensor histidine kinase [Flavobacteriaceae bacterium]
MFRSFICLLICSLSFSCALAQELNDYLLQLQTTLSDNERLVVLDSILSKSRQSDPELFVEHSLEYITLAKEVGDYEAAAKKAMNLQSPLTFVLKNPHKAVSTITGVLSHKYKIKDSFLLGGLYLKRGGAHFQINLNKAIEDYGLALKNFGEDDVVHKADAYLFRGQAYSSAADFIAAGSDFNMAYHLYESLEDFEYMLHAQQGNINMFSKNGFYEKALEAREKRINKLVELDLKQYLASAYYNQAVDYGKTGDKKKEFELLQLAVDHLEYQRRFSPTSLAIHGELIEYYLRANQPEKIGPHLDFLNTWKEGGDSDLFSKMLYHSSMANYEEHEGNLEEALWHAQEQLTSSEALGIEESIMSSHQTLGKLYTRLGDYQKGVENQSAYIALQDSLFNRNNANALAYYQTLYEAEKKEKQLVEKNTNIKLLESNNRAFKRQMFFVSLATLFLFGVVILFRNRKHLTQKKRLQERFSQELLVSQENERKRISKDLHDGIGQRLLLIKNKLIQKKDEDTKWMVDTAIDEVRAISRDLHPFQLQEMGLTRALEHSISQIDENTSLFITSEIDNIDNLFNREQEVNIYRIVQETFNNILKHAKAEASRISVKNLSNQVIISIKDNGIGFEFTEKLNDVKSLGLKTIMERTKFLNGQMRVHSVKNNGTVLEFQFPLA